MKLRFLAAGLAYAAAMQVPLVAQSATGAQHVSKQILDEAFREGVPLQTDLSVGRNISAQAVLLPAPVASRIFGKEIANSYAVIELNIGNKSRDAAFVLHGLYIDYSHWALSGTVPPTKGEKRTRASAMDAGRAQTDPSQVASVEARLVRGQLLDAQQWSARNWTVRLLTLAGTMASGYSFAFKEAGIAKGITAFTGDFIPGVAAAWPDGTVAQLNRISDFGYQTNKLVTKEDGEVVVAFFPIDRFLTPGLKALFLKSPALFFAPLSMLADDKAWKMFKATNGEILGTFTRGALLEALPSFKAKAERGEIVPDASLSGADRLLYTIGQISLNTIHLVVEGVMTVDVASVPAKIDSLEIEKASEADTWKKDSEVKGTIRGSFLSDGQVKIVEADTVGKPAITVDEKNSTDQILYFTMKLTQDIPDGTKLTFIVVKTDKQGRSVESVKREYEVKHP